MIVNIKRGSRRTQMKRNVKILFAAVALAALIFGMVKMQKNKVGETVNKEVSYITIKNNTALELENVRVTYNQNKELEVGNIKRGNSEKAEILSDDRQITEVKVTGEISAGEQFSGIFTGIVNNDTLLTVGMDEDYSMYVTSNIDTAY
jgi:hypothetical protein